MILINQETASELFRQHRQMVYHIALNIVCRAEEAEDIAMDTFSAMIAQRSFNSDEHAKAWLIRTTQNKAINVMKSSRIRRMVSIDELSEQALGVSDRQDCELLHSVMRLPQELKTAVYLHYYMDMKASEIGAALGVSENTIYKRLIRARKLLKIELEEGLK